MSNNIKQTLLCGIVGIAGSAFSPLSFGFGLGPISVHSHLGEPLDASINVVGDNAGAAGTLTVNLASDLEYKSHGVQKKSIHNRLVFRPEFVNGQKIIHVTSTVPIKEPFINFLVTVHDGGEKITREYAAFPDVSSGMGNYIPKQAKKTLPQSVTATAPIVERNESQTLGQIKLIPKKAASSTQAGWQGNDQNATTAERVFNANPDTERNQISGKAVGRLYGPVKNGETLYTVARNIRPSNHYSLGQIVRAIYHLNKQAFRNGNIDSLMAGSTLKLPDFSDKNWNRSIKETYSKKKSEISTNTLVKQEKTEEQDEHRKLSITDTSGQKDIANLIDQSKQEQTQSSNDFTSDPNQQIKDENTSKNSVTNSKEENSDIPTTGTSTQEVPISPQSDNQSAHNQSVETNTQNTPGIDKDSKTVDAVENKVKQNIDHNSKQMKDSGIVQNINHDMPVTPAITKSSPESSVNKKIINQSVVKQEGSVSEQPEEEGFLNQTIFFLSNWQWLAIFAVFLLILVGLILRKKKHAQNFDEDSGESPDFDSADFQALTEKIRSIENEDNLAETIDSDVQDNEINESDSNSTAESFSNDTHVDLEKSGDKLSAELDDVFENNLDETHVNTAGDQFTSELDDIFIDDSVNQSIPEDSLKLENTSNEESFSGLDDIFADDEEISHTERKQTEVASSSSFDNIFFDESQDPDDFFTQSRESEEKRYSSDEQGFNFDMNFDEQDVSEKNTAQNHDAGIDFSFDTIEDTENHQEPALEETKNKHSSQANLDDIFMEWDDEHNDIVEHISASHQSQASGQDSSGDLFGNAEHLVSLDEVHVIHKTQDEVRTEQDALDVQREMNISLDLASSFIVTGHGERARKWLEEVVELGDDEQRARAEKMLRDLDK